MHPPPTCRPKGIPGSFFLRVKIQPGGFIFSRVIPMGRDIMRVCCSSSAVLVACLIWISLSSASPAQNASGVEQQLFEAVNHERALRGLVTLRWDRELASAARNHAIEMARQNALSHQFPGEPNLPTRVRQAGAHYSWLSEDVDQGQNAASIHRQLMASPLHRANLLDTDMDSAGIGAAEAHGQWFAVEDFSKAK
jgi:uncharacterized protein YkwD